VQVIGEASDGVEAVQKAQQLQPDLILLDIGLPLLSGIEAARRIRMISPKSKILFVSENLSWDIAEAALAAGGLGYVVKSNAARELLPAVAAVLRGEQFLGTSLGGRGVNNQKNEPAGENSHPRIVVEHRERRDVYLPRHHEVGFYSDDASLVDDAAEFLGAALRAGNVAILIATPSHREGILHKLQASGLNMGAAVERHRYIPRDAAETLSEFGVDGTPDSVQFMKVAGDLILTAAKTATGGHCRVAIFGEGINLLWAQGDAEAVLQVEDLSCQLTAQYDVDIRCGYSRNSTQGGMDKQLYQQICARHSAVYSR
jgi:CheY-like chemotaxis protein